VITVQLDLPRLAEARGRFPVLENRQLPLVVRDAVPA